MANALGDLQVAVWANPGLGIIGICPDAGLGGVLDPALYLGASNTKSGSR